MEKVIINLAKELWGPPLITMLVVLGLILSCKSRFFQVRRFPQIIKSTFGEAFFSKKDGKDGFKAMCMALGGTIGVGNIAGVSTAIVTGGPGAVFWMWISGFLGMIIKYFEVALAVKFRVKSVDGQYKGGPMYYMVASGIKFLKPMSYIFACFCVISSLFMGDISQSNTVSSAFNYAFGISKEFVCIVLCVFLLPVIMGKAEKIKDFTAVFVPIMSILYITICIIVILRNKANLVNSFCLIFKDAFNFRSVSSGVGGYGIMRAVSVGFSRGLFTNEAGLGSSPIAHATNPEATEFKQGMWGIAEVFVDTILVCSLTAFAVLGSNTFISGTPLNGVDLTSAAFSESVGKIMGERMIAVSVSLFAFASMVAWNFYGRTALSFLTNNRFIHNIYAVVFIVFSYLGSFAEENVITSLADIFNAPLILINIPVIAMLYPFCLEKIKRKF